MFLFCVDKVKKRNEPSVLLELSQEIVYTRVHFLVELKTIQLLSYWILLQTQMELFKDFNNADKVKKGRNKVKNKVKKNAMKH